MSRELNLLAGGAETANYAGRAGKAIAVPVLAIVLPLWAIGLLCALLVHWRLLPLIAVLGLAAAALVVAVAGGLHLAANLGAGLTAPADALRDHLSPDERIGPRDRASWLRLSPLFNEFQALAASLRGRSERDAQKLAELTQARDSALSASLAKSEFLANISHQLRTPLNSIIGYATLMQEDAAGSKRPEEVQDLERILQASRNLLELINDLLDLSKIEAGKASFQRSILDVSSIVSSAVASCDPQRHGNGNLLQIDVDDGIGIMIGDGAKIRQCLINLVSNALKFTQDGEVRLTVSAMRTEAGEIIRFSVSDTGVGMSEDQVAGLFDDLGPDRDPGACGASGRKLGLAITHRLATMMGGSVRARSVLDQGSVFTLDIPREMPRTIPADDVLPFIDKGGQAHEAGDKRALIIDDDPSAIDIMRRWLQRLDYAIITAPDGETGLELARIERPDLIILDLFMPGLSGYEVLEAIRTDEAISDIPVIVVTVGDDRSGALRSGAAEWLLKPVRPKELEQVLDVYGERLAGEVLIIENDPDAAALMSRTAAQIGLSSRIAGDGVEGLAMLRDDPPAAIMLDLGLPRMDGFEVLRALASDDRLSRIPVIIVSGREISVLEHQVIARAGGVFHSKGQASPREIARSLRMAVAR